MENPLLVMSASKSALNGMQTRKPFKVWLTLLFTDHQVVYFSLSDAVSFCWFLKLINLSSCDSHLDAIIILVAVVWV